MAKPTAKEKVMEAAAALFYHNGFHGTSVRDIADRANVNVSLISYYFKSKQGLLESAVTTYYDEYLAIIEGYMNTYQKGDALPVIKHLLHDVLTYQMEHYQLTAVVYRELSLDSTFAREMLVTYVAKENFFLRTLFFDAISKEWNKMRDVLFIQWKGMLASPFMMKHERIEQIMDRFEKEKFVTDYELILHHWVYNLAKK
ncbi:MAG TPA: forespore capture DNA-binding protein RefZ [Pseudogracilibacillus sp.]|nr:forespore capture DNA-binding protein RefZ [Pseudogracilibacillus sp.]